MKIDPYNHEERLEQLKGYGGEIIDEIRKEILQEINEGKKSSLVDGLSKHL